MLTIIYNILEPKNTFLGYKNTQFKKSKNWNFSKGLTHAFGPKMAIFSTLFFLGNIGQENVFYDILERKNVFLGYKNMTFKKTKKFRFFQRGKPIVLVQKWPFFHLLFLGNIGQVNVFYDILEQKNAFLDYKNKKLKKSKNWDFSKGVNPWFWSKNGHFSILFF